MVNLLKTDYTKSEALLLPLTHLTKSQKYKMNSYLFWEDYSIENFNLILKFEYDDFYDFVAYCKRIVFPTLDKNGYVIESYNFVGETIFVLDMSEWALDIKMFLKGKYSKMSREAHKLIKEYHTFYDKGPRLDVRIHTMLEPKEKFGVLGGVTAIEYISENYGIDRDILEKLGEVGSIYDKEKETLVISSDRMSGIYGGNNICTI